MINVNLQDGDDNLWTGIATLGMPSFMPPVLESNLLEDKQLEKRLQFLLVHLTPLF